MNVGRWSIGILGLLVILHWSTRSPAKDPPKLITEPAESVNLMQMKLQHSQRALEGLVTENYEAIAKAADAMLEVSHHAQWDMVMNDPVYNHFTIEFQRLTQKLSQQADQKNLEASAYTYQLLTATCITCHQHVRNIAAIETGD